MRIYHYPNSYRAFVEGEIVLIGGQIARDQKRRAEDQPSPRFEPRRATVSDHLIDPDDEGDLIVIVGSGAAIEEMAARILTGPSTEVAAD